MKRIYLLIGFVISISWAFGQSTNGYNTELGHSNAVTKMNGRFIYAKSPTYVATDSGLVYSKRQVDSAIAVNTGGASLAFINGGNSFGGGYRSVLGNNDSAHLDVITDGLRRLRVSNNGYFFIGDSANAISAGPGNLKILGNTVFGYQSGISFSNASLATNNTAFGSQALKADTTGYSNSAFGNGALRSNLSGYQNAAIGQNALAANTTGFNNMAIGTVALSNNTTGYQNIGINYASLATNTTGHDNIAIGFSALTTSNSTGLIGIGSYALQSLTSGFSDISIGGFSSNKMTSGALNTAVGYQSLYLSTTGNDNTGVGFYAGYNNVLGNGNVFLGFEAGDSSTGNNQLYISDSLDRTLIFGNFVSKEVLINASGPKPSFLTGDNFQVNGSGYFSDSVRLNIVANGTTSDSVLVRNSATKSVHMVAQSSIGGSSYTFTNGLTNSSGTVSLGGALTGATTITGTGQTFTYTAGGTGTFKWSGFSQDTTSTVGVDVVAPDSSRRMIPWAKFALKLADYLPTYNIYTHNGLYSSGGDSIGLGTNPLDQNTTLPFAGNTLTMSGGPLAYTGGYSWGPGSGLLSSTVSIRPGVMTDVTSAASSTLTNVYVVGEAGPTLGATNTSVTYTNAYSFFINGPTAGTNVTITNPYALGITGNSLLQGSVAVTGVLTAGTVNIYGKNDLTAQTGAVGTVTSYSVPGSGSFNTFRVGGYITVTAVSLDVIQLQVTWTDETNTSRTQSFFVQGATTGISATGANAYSPMDIRVKQGTPITVATVLTTGTGSITYDVGATITQLY